MVAGIATGLVYALLFISLYFEVFLLISFLRYLSSRSATSRNAPYEPRVAVVVPCFNESAGIAATLDSLLALEYPADKLQIIVVDDGSTDDTLAIARSYEPRVTVLAKENGGKHTAMNYALAHTDAEIMGCLDADSTVKPDALRHAVAAFTSPQIAAVTPAIHVKDPSSLLQHMQVVEYRLALFNRFMLAGLGSTFITPGPFSFFRTAVVRELGGWRSAHSTEDMEMAMRIQEAGYAIANAPKVSVYTTAPHSLPKLYRQRVRWTYGFLQNLRDYRHMLGTTRFGHLGLFILPIALISVGTGMFFFVRIVIDLITSAWQTYERYALTGALPQYSFDFFYINTSMLMFLVFLSVGLVVLLISAGSWIGHESRRPPLSTPLFVLFYGFIAPLWLFAAVARATLRTGVRWR